MNILHHATLLEKQGDKYITNFFIADKNCCLEVYNVLRSEARERSQLLQEFITDKLLDIKNIGIAGEHIDDNTIRWWLIPDLVDYLIDCTVKGKHYYEPPKRSNGETWGFVGHERTNLPEKTEMGHNGINDSRNDLWVYKYGDYSLWDQCGEPEYEEAMLLCDCIRNKRLVTSFTAVEERIWKGIEGKYAHTTSNGEIISDIITMRIDEYRKIHRILQDHKNYILLIQNTTRVYERIEEIFKKYSHKILHDSIGYNIRMELFAMRMMAIHDLVDNGILTLPKDPSKSVLGMCIVLR